MSSEKRVYHIVLSMNGNFCRIDPRDTQIYCKNKINDMNAMWVFYDDSGRPTTPKNGGVYSIQNYGTGRWVDFDYGHSEEGGEVVMGNTNHAKFRIVMTRDGFEIYRDVDIGPLAVWTVENFIVLLTTPQGLGNQMFRFTDAL